jgi:hypothetical protein
MATLTNKRKVLRLSIERKVSDSRNRKWQKADVSGIWSHKFYDSNDVEKQNHNY